MTDGREPGTWSPDAWSPDAWSSDDADDILTEGLAALATDGPPGLLERIAASWVRLPGPTCDLYVASTDRGVVYVRTSDAVHDDAAEFATMFHRRFTRPLLAGARPPAELLAALHADRLARIRFDLSRLSAFEREVLLAVLTIPRGQVRPYGWIAHRLGGQTTVQAVDIVLRHNPVPVLIPCHRVIHADGTLGAHALGATAKRALLDAEGTNLGEVSGHVASDAPATAGRPAGHERPHSARPCPGCRTTPEEAG
jgi:methylated-DNA-[protein]-cysteine S-methyltransferase